VAAPIPKKISQILPTFQNVAQTSNYLVQFSMPPGGLRDFLESKGVDWRFHSDQIGLLCNRASLPGSGFATADIVGDYQGVVEKRPHTRKFTQITLDFYVDNEYKTLKFLEHWMEYISGGSSANSVDDAYNFKMRYPEEYRSENTKIIKFEKNYRQSLEYGFRGLFPYELNSTRIQYDNSQVLVVSANFLYDRYICGESSSWARERGVDRNRKGIDKSRAMNRFMGGEASITETLNANAPGNKELRNNLISNAVDPNLNRDGTVSGSQYSSGWYDAY
tara:strand:+ start:320 stop:1150 length:831 start_codon:yes stop_codon:yes gene_type:complete